MFRSFLLGEFGDNTGLFLTHLDPNLFGAPLRDYVSYAFSTQLLSWDLFIFLAKFLDPVFIYNTWVLLTLILNFLTVLLILKRFFKQRVIHFGLALTFTLSPYFYYQYGVHIDLAQVWLINLAIYYISSLKSFKSYILMGIYLGLVFSVSNYLGYFSALLFLVYFFSNFLIVFILKKSGIFTEILKVGILFLVFVVVSIFLLTPYFFYRSELLCRHLLAHYQYH